MHPAEFVRQPEAVLWCPLHASHCGALCVHLIVVTGGCSNGKGPLTAHNTSVLVPTKCVATLMLESKH